MLIRIAETNEVRDLCALDRNTGVEWTKDLVEAGNLQRDDEGIHIMSRAGYDWWRQYISDMDADEGELNDLTDELRRLGVDNAADEVRDIVADYLAYMDMEDHHKGRQRAIAEIRERHGLSVSELDAAQ